MLKRIGLMVTAVSLAALAGGTFAAASSDSPLITGARTIVVHAHTTNFASLDLGAPGPSAGDQTFRKEDLTDSTGTKVGVENSQCTTNTPSDPFMEMDLMCFGTITLAGKGEIHWQSLAVIA